MIVVKERLGGDGIRMTRRRTTWVVGAAATLVAISVAHVLEDFVYGVPDRLGFETAPAAGLVGAAYGLHAVLIALAARDHVLGYLGNLTAGAFWLAAAAADHLEEVLFADAYRAGLISRTFAASLMVAGLVLAVVSVVAWRSRRRAGERAGP
jgi:hypothetical protein